MSDKIQKKIPVIKIALLISLIPYLAIAFFALPMADDWGMAYMVDAKGFWGTHSHWYQFDGGRYIGMGMTSVYAAMTNFSTQLYWTVPWLMILGTFLSFFFLLSAMASPFISGRKLAWGGLTLTAIYLARVPSITEGYFWLMGSTCYTLGNILVLFLAGLLILIHRTEIYKRRLLYTGIASLCAVAAVGVNEILMLLMVICLSVYMTYLFIQKHTDRTHVLFIFLVTAACAVFVITAPGNAVRGGHFPNRHQFWFSLTHSLNWTYGFVKTWVSDALILSSTALMLPFIAHVSHRISIPKNLRKWLFLMPIFWLGLVALSFFPGFWALGGPPPDRVWNLTFFLFIVGWYTCVIIYTLLLLPNQKPETILPQHFRTAAKGLFLIALLFFPNTYTAFKDLFFQARPYHQEVKERIETAKKSKEKNLDYMIVRPLVNRPATLFSHSFEFKNEEEFPEYWVNKNWGDYWGLKVIFRKD